MRALGVAATLGGRSSFAPATEPVIGNQNPGWTGSPGDKPTRPAPHARQQYVGGNVGNFDGYSGADPAVAKIQPAPRVIYENLEQDYSGVPRRVGIIGFNDQLQVRDRHAYWNRGSQLFGSTPSVPGTPPNPHSDGPAMPALNTVNISVNPQIGSSNTAAQDDLSRAYTWLGQQDGTVQAVYGGVPGLYASYGNRGFASGIHDPSDGQGGPAQVYPGPPHGLHSDTIPDGKQLLDRYKTTPQMKSVRQDRPSNSRIAGQSFSQTVPQQGSAAAHGNAQRAGRGSGLGLSLRLGGKGGQP